MSVLPKHICHCILCTFLTDVASSFDSFFFFNPFLFIWLLYFFFFFSPAESLQFDTEIILLAKYHLAISAEKKKSCLDQEKDAAE